MKETVKGRYAYPKVNEFYESASKVLKDKLNVIPTLHEEQLNLTCQQLEKYYECQQIIDEDGIVIRSGGRLYKNPATIIQKECLRQFKELLNTLMLTLSSADKARKVDHTEENNALAALLGKDE